MARTYARCSGISLVSPGATAGGAGSVGGVIINSEEFLKFESDQSKFIQQHIELYMRYLKKDSRAGENSFDPRRLTVRPSKPSSIALFVKTAILMLKAFNPLKARHFDSSWNWVRQDALLMYYDIISSRLTTVDYRSLYFPTQSYRP